MPLPPRGITLLRLLKALSSDEITNCSINAPLLELHDPKNLDRLITALRQTTRLISVSFVNTPIHIMCLLINCLNSLPTIKNAEITIRGISSEITEGLLLQLAAVLNNRWLKTMKLVLANPIQTGLFIKALKTVPDIMEIEIAQTFFGTTAEEAAKVFQDDLLLSPGIRKLALSNNNLDDRYAEFLSVLLQRNRSLLVLNLTGNMISVDGLRFLRLQVETHQITTIIEGLRYEEQELECNEELLHLQSAILANNHLLTQSTVDTTLEEINKFPLASTFPTDVGGIIYDYLKDPLIEDLQSQFMALQRVFTRATLVHTHHFLEKAGKLVCTYLYGEQRNSSDKQLPFLIEDNTLTHSMDRTVRMRMRGS